MAFAEPATGTGFGRVLAAEGVSNFGTMLSRLALPWLAVLAIGATPWQMAALAIAQTLAEALATLWLGAWVERRGKRAVMLGCDAFRAVLLALLVAAAWAGVLGFAGLLAVAALGALATAAFEIARSAWIARRIEAGALPQRNAQLSMVGSLSETAAFAVGGWLYQGLGALVVLAVDALSFVASALCLRGVPEVPPGPRNSPQAGPARPAWRALWDAAAEGVRAVRGHAVLRPLAGIQALLAFGFGMTGTAYAIYTARDLALPPAWLGMIAASGALGAMAGAALAPWLGRRLGPGRALALGLAALAAGAACIPLAGSAGAAAAAFASVLLVAHQIVGDGGHTVAEVHDRTLRQTVVAPALLARADAGLRTVAAWAALAGAVAGGALGEALGARAVLTLAAATAGTAALVATLSLPRLWGRPD